MFAGDMQNKMQAGFTLIELIVVIVLLGILAATALPKYSGMQIGARAASLNSARGAIMSAMNIAYATQQSLGLASNVDVVLDGSSISMVNGYPVASHAVSGIFGAAGLSQEYSYVLGTGGALPNTTLVINLGGAPTPATCQFSYTSGSSAGVPAVGVPAIVSVAVTTGC